MTHLACLFVHFEVENCMEPFACCVRI